MAQSVKWSLATMSDEDMMRMVRGAMNRATASMEMSEEIKLGVDRLRADFDKFVQALPGELKDLGVLLLTQEQMEVLLNQIGVAMAERLLAKARQKNERWWDARWTRWTAIATVLTVLLSAVMSLLRAFQVIP